MGILVWLIIVNLAVFVHELSHFLAARAQGVKVRAFSIGMGPILARRLWRGTEWRISALPVGGYVDIEGLAPTEVDSSGKPIPPTTGMARLGFLGKFAILFAGPLSNVVLAIILVSAMLVGQGKPQLGSEIRFQSVQPGSKAELVGFKKGDLIAEINGEPLLKGDLAKLVPDDPKRLEALDAATKRVRENLHQNGERSYVVYRDNSRLEFKFDWSPKTFGDQSRPLFGVSIGPSTTYLPVGLVAGVSEATTQLLGSIPGTVQAIFGGIFKTFTLQRDPNLSGPVGAVGVAGQVAQQGFWQIVFFAGIINLSLGIFNLLPIPGLDGGRILLSAIVALRRKPFAPGQEETINFAGFMFVILFIVLVTVQDFGKLAR